MSMTLTGIMFLSVPVLLTWGLYDLSQWCWARQRARGSDYWQALLDSERK
jgi:hypothetical protein